jgi:hypothetical protein
MPLKRNKVLESDSEKETDRQTMDRKYTFSILCMSNPQVYRRWKGGVLISNHPHVED